MRNRMTPFVLPVLATAIACTQPTVNTVPAPVSAVAEVQYYDLDVPSDLDIRTVDFSASSFAEVSDGQTTATDRGRAFVKVHAVHRATGVHFLLLYEDVANRKRPVQIIRFVPGSVRASPDSTGSHD